MAEPMGLDASSDTVFCEATPEQRQIAWELNGACWAAPMPLDAYLERETVLSEQDLSKDGGCRYWVLYLKGYPRQVIASCETTRKTVLLSENGVSREGHGYAIACVYTNPAYRRQGMAAFMLRRVQEQMDKDSDCSVLYSDIGKNFYSILGWRVFPSKQATLILLPPTAASTGGEKPVFKHSQPSRTRYLQLEQLPDLCEVDELNLSARFDALRADGKTHVAFLPSYAQISWHLKGTEFMAGKLLGRTPANKGAIADNGRSWVYWVHDWREKKLKVMRVVMVLDSTPEQRVADIRVLLEAALVEASAWGLSSVLIWNPDDEMIRGCKAAGNAHPEDVKIVFDERTEGSIPSLRWAEGKDARNTVWEDNFYYCWC
jgi:GNAT superfamily N-acetyltransferase